MSSKRSQVARKVTGQAHAEPAHISEPIGVDATVPVLDELVAAIDCSLKGGFWEIVSGADDEARMALRALRDQFRRRWNDAQIEVRRAYLNELRLRFLATTKQDDVATPASEAKNFRRDWWDRWLDTSRRMVEEIFQSMFKVFMATLSDDQHPAGWPYVAVTAIFLEVLEECEKPSDLFACFTVGASDETVAAALQLRREFRQIVLAQLQDLYTDAQVKMALTERAHRVPSLGALYGLRSRDPRSAAMIKELGRALVTDITWARNLPTDRRNPQGIEILPAQILRQVKFEEAAKYIWGDKKHIGETEAAIEIISRRCGKSLTQATVGRYLREIAHVTDGAPKIEKMKKAPPAAKTKVGTPRLPGNKRR